MSTIKVTNINNASASSGGIALDSSGHVQVDGLQMPTAGALSNRNKIINGDMRIDQRNDGAAVNSDVVTNPYTVDRWRSVVSSGSNQFSAQRSTTSPDTFTNSLLLTSLAATTVAATDVFALRQPIEGFNCADLMWGTATAKTVTLSFWVRSSIAGTFGGALQNQAQNRSYPFNYSIASANAWEYKTITIAGDTTGTWATDNSGSINVYFAIGMGSNRLASAGSWAAGDYRSSTGSTNLVATNGATFYITGVQLEVGEKATPFEHRSYGDELARCERYFELITSFGEAFMGYSYSSSGANCPIRFRTIKRAAPGTITLAPAGQGAGQLTFLTSVGGFPTVTGTNSAALPTTDGFRIDGASYSGLSIGAPSALYIPTNVAVLAKVDAEL